MTASTTHVTHADKRRGLLLGAGLGDALGAPFQGHTTVDADTLAAEERAPSQLVHTDDTVLTIVLAEHLAAGHDTDVLDENALAREFAAAWKREPWRGFDSGTPPVFGLLHAGVAWSSAAKAFLQAQASQGNGAAARVAPVALVGTSVQQTRKLALRSAAITHAHAHGRHGAECQAAAVYLALHSNPAQSLDSYQFLRDIVEVLPSQLWREQLDRVSRLADSADPARAARILGNDSSALGSVPLALLAFLRNPDDPADAIRYAVRAGGATDTIASMAGTLAGARSGGTAFPQSWLRRFPTAAALYRLADQLAATKLPNA
ncbi:MULTISPECIES: ADP-ribosylglycohydrolase family protein [Lentzea]|uniref:Poly(ADP-ribose) glycohydrolase ARH3 n=2 Tax=Lentzea TaxID=165301 RepID=A0A1W2DCV3_9PSEU|nr:MULTISPECIES: ADP-ribosylglycohydrolase family protein [Lentzea]MDX8140498.1 ADP-ribosylglycohydrolase family protein [Lentzea sp. BCCO 10_0061]SMC94916.1 poly(ADP-ribose) glycohydrolase ARH3 [Lentzea albidocapillata]